MRTLHVFCYIGSTVLLISSNPLAQAMSAVQFWDTTGTAATAKIGWSGKPGDGKFYISTPLDSEVVIIQNGNMMVNGTVDATNLKGNGSAIDEISSSSHVHPEIGAIQSSKSDVGHTHRGSEISDSVPLSKISTVGAASQQVLTFDGTNAAWQNPPASNGTTGVTSVGTDSGLVVSPSTGTGNVKVSVGNKAITKEMIADGAISTAKIAMGTANDVLTKPVQQLVWYRVSHQEHLRQSRQIR